MADIFISYSRRDLDQALSLVERLTAAGFDVWIDKHGIEGANSWSKEIANALESASTFLLLLSESSVVSPNVSKELGVATLLQKRIVPLRLDRTELRGEFLYHLANLQYVWYEEFDALVSVLNGKPTARGKTRAKSTDVRKTLMILPFDDLSPTADNGWFADGIVSEMISALSNIKSLIVTDPQTTKDFKHYKGTLPVYAKEMSIRYFVHGDVRKFGDSIKITARLLDIATGDYLWQDSMKGTMSDIFDIQEEIAKRVLGGLSVILSAEEKTKLETKQTANAEAYELHLKAGEYFYRHTKEGFQLAAQLNSEAIRLDPTYAQAYAGKANALSELCRTYTPSPALLEEGLELIHKALRLKPDLWSAYNPLSHLLLLQGNLEAAERAAKDYISNAPDDYNSYSVLGYFYSSTGRPAEAIVAYEAALKFKHDDLVTLRNIVVNCNEAKDLDKRKHWALAALPLFEKRLKLFPDDEHDRVSLAILLQSAGMDEDAKAAVRQLEDIKDGNSLFNTACVHSMLGDRTSGLRVFRKAIEAGFRNMHALKGFLNDEVEGLGTLRVTAEWEEARALLDTLEEEQTDG